MNNIAREHRTIPEDMFTKNKYCLFSSCCGGSQDALISLPFHIPQLMKSLPFYIYLIIGYAVVLSWPVNFGALKLAF